MSGSTTVITAGLLLTAALVSAQTASQLIDFHFFDLGVRMLDSDHHGSVFGVISILAQAAAAAAIGVRAASRRKRDGLVAAALVGVLIVPRALEGRVSAFKQYDVPIVIVPLAIVFVVAFALTLRDARKVRSIVWASLVLLVFSFALHAVGPQADGITRPNVVDYTWAYQLTGMVKHGAELAGWMLLATGMTAGVWRRMGGEVPTVADIPLLLRRKRPI